ncbi:flagellar motor protein MotA [Salinarimonas sp.]|uniref:flagellar motor protein MotA n=1 Tax=Salinarimonas sp. TaxID=2766526 RepID=UPI0032D99926
MSAPRIYLVRMGVFLVLAGFLAFILYEPIWEAFLANPGLNGIIVGVLFIGIVLALRQVVRLFRETRWVNSVDLDTGESVATRQPVLLAPVAQAVNSRANGGGPIGLPVATLRSLLDSVAARLDESREIVRYLAGLLILLGLLGTFWGLIETVGAVGANIASLRSGGDAAVLFDELKSSLAAPLTGIGIAFSSSLFGLGSSLVVGFLDLQAGQAQNRFFTELEDHLSAYAVEDTPPVSLSKPGAAAGVPPELAAAIARLTQAVEAGQGGRATSQAMANLAEGIQGLVQHMRAEQQMIRDWVEAQAQREKELKQVLERIASEKA